MNDTPRVPSSDSELRAEVERLRLLQSISEDFAGSLDFDELLPRVFDTVLTAVGAQGGALWIAEGDVLRCRLAVGSASQKLVGTETPIGEGFVGDVARRQRSTIVTDAMHDPRFQMRLDRSSTMITTTVMAAPMVVKGTTVGSIQVNNKVTGDIFDDHDRQLLEGLASSAAVALRNAQLHTAEKRARNLAVLLEISREITSTLDLDRILHSVVNLAPRALSFDYGAVGLHHKGRVEIRAVTGQETVEPKDERAQRTAARGLWALERGEAFYLMNGGRPVSEAEQAFVSAFGDGLSGDGVVSGLYLPLSDEEGTLGLLVFEAAGPDFLSEPQQELAGVLANQTTVALRNAELYNQVPLVDMLGAFAAHKKRLMSIPRRRLTVLGALALAGLMAVTLIRWPLRVAGTAPAFRPVSYASVRPMVAGVIERVWVREGTAVTRGDPLFQVRGVALRADRAEMAAEAEIAAATAAAAAARGDAAGERMERGRAVAIGQELALLDEQLAATTVRAPVSGVVLTARPEELVGVRPEAGDDVLVVGRTDTLELEFGVDQRDLDRAIVGRPIRLRIDALPQRTFEGIVTFLGPMPYQVGERVLFPVRAMVPNDAGLLKPGMMAHAKVLTEPASVAERVMRPPVRWLRLLLWRLKP
ncbi:MAG TPA: GAF domain-containing protein [Gemmatimonadales bacterium]